MTGVDATVTELIASFPCMYANRTQALHHVLVVAGNGFRWSRGEVARRYDPVDCRATHERLRVGGRMAEALARLGEDVDESLSSGTCPAEHLRAHAEILALTPGPLGRDAHPANTSALLANLPSDVSTEWMRAARDITQVIAPLWAAADGHEQAPSAGLTPEQAAFVAGQRHAGLLALAPLLDATPYDQESA